MKKNYIGYYPIKESEIKELVKLIRLYIKRDYSSVKKIFKKFNCTIQQQENIKELLTNCILNTDEEFFDTQYGICIAQLQKLYRKHFVIENLSLTQLLNRMNASSIYTKKWNEIFAFSDNKLKFVNCLKYPKSSGVFIPSENVKKLYKDYFTNLKIKKIIEDYYGINTNLFLKLLEYCISENCGLLEAFDLTATNTSSITSVQSKSKKVNNTNNKKSSNKKETKKSSNLIYDTTIPFIPEFEENIYTHKTKNRKKTSNLIYDISEYDNNTFSPISKSKKSASNLINNTPTSNISYIPEFEDNYYNYNPKTPKNNYSNLIYNNDIPDIPYIPEFEDNYNMPNIPNKSSNLIYDTEIPDISEFEDELYTPHKTYKKKSSNLIYDTEIPDIPEFEDDKKYFKNNNLDTIKPTTLNLNKEKKQNTSKYENIEQTNSVQSNKTTKQNDTPLTKWFPLTLIISTLYLIFNIGIECVFEFIETYLFKSSIEITNITYIAVGIQLILNIFIWIIITLISLKNKFIRKKDRKKIIFFVLIFMIIQVSATIYLKDISIKNDIKNKINDITNFNTEYEISKLNQEINELQSSKYSNNNLTRAKIKDLENELSDYNYYLENKKSQSNIITTNYNEYFKYYTYYIPAINASMLLILRNRLKKHSNE